MNECTKETSVNGRAFSLYAYNYRFMNVYRGQFVKIEKMHWLIVMIVVFVADFPKSSVKMVTTFNKSDDNFVQ